MTTRTDSWVAATTKLAHGLAACAAFAIAATTAASAVADVVRLEDLEAHAGDRRAVVGAARARVASARANVELGRTAYLPNIVLNVGGSLLPGSQLVEITDETGKEFFVTGSRHIGQTGAFIPAGRYSAVVSLQERVYDFGRTGSAVAAAESRAGAARASEALARAGVGAEVRAAYLDWLGSTALHALAERRLADGRARVELVRTRIESGARPPSDLPLAQYEQTVAELEENAAHGRAEGARLELARAAATELAEDAEPDPSLFARALPSEGPGTTPEMVALEKRRDAVLATALADERTNSPVLGAALDAGVRGQNERVFPHYQVGVTLSLPLWDGNASSTRADVSREEAAAVGAEVRERRAALRTDYERAKKDGSGAIERLRIAEALRTIALARAQDARDRYDLGDGKLEPVLDAQGDQLSAEREVVLAKIARTDAALRLESWSRGKPVRSSRKP
jgi:outer membrane protein TolC